MNVLGGTGADEMGQPGGIPNPRVRTHIGPAQEPTQRENHGAEEGIRTPDNHLGKVGLYRTELLPQG